MKPYGFLSRLRLRSAFPSHLRGVVPQVGVVSCVPSSLLHPCECYRDSHVHGCPRRPLDRTPPQSLSRPTPKLHLNAPDRIPGFDAATMTVNGESLVLVMLRNSGMSVERPGMNVTLIPGDIPKRRRSE